MRLLSTIYRLDQGRVGGGDGDGVGVPKLALIRVIKFPSVNLDIRKLGRVFSPIISPRKVEVFVKLGLQKIVNFPTGSYRQYFDPLLER